MRITILLALILLSSCGGGFNSNNFQFEQLVVSETPNYTKFDTTYFHTMARGYLINGTLLQQQNDYAGAILEFQEALRYDSSAAIEYAVAQCYAQLGKTDLSKQHLFRSIKLNPEFAQSFDLLTEIYLYNNEYENAEITNSSAINIKKTDKRLLTKALIQENDAPEQSLKIYDSIKDPQYKDMISTRKIYLYKQMGKTDSLLTYLKQQQQLEPYNTQVSREIFQTYLIDNQISLAIDYLDVVDTLYSGNEQQTYYVLIAATLMRSHPMDTTLVNRFLNRLTGSLTFDDELMYYAGFLASSVGNNQKRDTFFDRVLKIASHNSDFRVGVAETYYFDKEYQRSLDILDSLEVDSLKQIEYYYTLKGLNNYMLKQYGKAIENYKKILEIDSSYNNYITLTMLGEVYSMMGKTDTALYYYNIQYNIDSNNVYLLNNYAYILSKEKKDLDRALAMSAKTLEVSPNNSAYLDTYGWIKYQMEDYDAALEYIKKAVDLGDVSAEVYEHLGDTYIKLGETEKAKVMYLKSLEIEADRFKLEDKLEDKTGK